MTPTRISEPTVRRLEPWKKKSNEPLGRAVEHLADAYDALLAEQGSASSTRQEERPTLRSEIGRIMKGRCVGGRHGPWESTEIVDLLPSVWSEGKDRKNVMRRVQTLLSSMERSGEVDVEKGAGKRGANLYYFRGAYDIL